MQTICLRIDRRSPDRATSGRNPDMVKDSAMESSGLFSHPHQPEVVPESERSTEPVQAPVFSDRPRNDSTADTPPSS